mmetsp:Transcript_99441/g.181398  ORF Transcript_99441/g.181398 Transcript_99441/m.181398 type:complete len:87 (+) Transcript_99441:150-410(+)
MRSMSKFTPAQQWQFVTVSFCSRSINIEVISVAALYMHAMQIGFPVEIDVAAMHARCVTHSWAHFASALKSFHTCEGDLPRLVNQV